MKHYLLYAAGLIAAASVTSCVDDKYDLSDIDTTARIQVDNLTIPVNVDAITLSSLLDLDPNDPDAKVKEVNGIYAVVENGDFHSEMVHINQINANGVAGDPKSNTVSTGLSGSIRPEIDLEIPFSSSSVDFKFESSTVPAEIREIKRVDGAFTLRLTLELPALKNVTRRVWLEDAVISLPKGLVGTPNAGSYDPEKGTISIPSVEIQNGCLEVLLNCSAINFAQTGGIFTPNSTADGKGYLNLRGEMSIESGKLVIRKADVIGNLPASFTVTSSIGVSNITVTGFTGRLCYDIADVNIDPVTLNDLPDILAQEDTRISLLNPQIYLAVTNPLHDYALKARTGMSIKSVFSPEQATPDRTVVLDAPGYFEVSSAAQSSYVLSPTKPETYYEGYANATHVPFSGLSTILEGNGLPKSLNISLDNPTVFDQPVENLPLGRDLGAVNGKYQFYAPLALGAGSQVTYTDTQDGWNDEDVDAITIENLEVTTTVSSNVPFSLKLTGYPIDIHGNRINNVSIDGADIPANADNQAVTIRISGAITHLDGIVFTAVGNVPSNAQALAPQQSIICRDIRATVSGYYEKEL